MRWAWTAVTVAPTMARTPAALHIHRPPTILIFLAYWHVFGRTLFTEPSACTASIPPPQWREQQLLSALHSAPLASHPPNTAPSSSGFSFLALKGNPSFLF